jgi:short-subunit dehydrogenase
VPVAAATGYLPWLMALPTPAPELTAVVTGASSGIGAEIARELARRGHGVTLVARRAELLQDLAGELSAAHGIRAEVVPADLTDPAARAGIAAELEQRGLGVAVLVNNAGLSTTGPVHRSAPADELRMIGTNVDAVVDLCTRFLPQMVERGAGGILNVASTAAFQPLPGQAGYGASKAFVLSYGHALRGELRGRGVHVTTLCPGPVHTGFGEAAGFSAEESEGALPKFMWEEADDVARAGVAGLAADHAVVIPGLANRVGAGFAAHVPRRFLVPLLARQHPKLRES